MKIQIVVIEDKEKGFTACLFDPFMDCSEDLSAYALTKEAAVQECQRLVSEHVRKNGIDGISRLGVEYINAEMREVVI